MAEYSNDSGSSYRIWYPPGTEEMLRDLYYSGVEGARPRKRAIPPIDIADILIKLEDPRFQNPEPRKLEVAYAH